MGAYFGDSFRSYEYDAFGNQLNIDPADTNPFRYCGEYYDAETGSYYLRARYYDSSLGRFTQEDPHWNTGNMIYGDDPAAMSRGLLDLEAEYYLPSVLAMRQSGNLYSYCVNSPVFFYDPDGQLAIVAGIGSSGILGSIGAIITNPYIAGTALVGTTVAWGGAKLRDQIHSALLEADEIKSWVKTQVNTKSIDDKKLKDYSVYVIQDAIMETVYVGMTKNYGQRQYSHQRKADARFPEEFYKMSLISTGLSYKEARALEQTLIEAYTLLALKNAINSISKKNYAKYEYELNRAAQLISGLYDFE